MSSSSVETAVDTERRSNVLDAPEVVSLLSLPRNVLSAIACRLASGRDRLESLTSRVRGLLNLASTSCEMRDIVRHEAIPELIRLEVPAYEIDAHKKRTKPTLEEIAATTDAGLSTLQRTLCSHLAINPIHYRKSVVKNLLLVSQRDWDVVVLIRELKARRLEWLNLSQAFAEYRLKPADVRRRSTYSIRREDAMDLALEIHGSSDVLDRIFERHAERSERRMTTLAMRSAVRFARRRDLMDLLGMDATDVTAAMNPTWSGLIRDATVKTAIDAYLDFALHRVRADSKPPSTRVRERDAEELRRLQSRAATLSLERLAERNRRQAEVDGMPFPDREHIHLLNYNAATTLDWNLVRYPWIVDLAERQRVLNMLVKLSTRWQDVVRPWGHEDLKTLPIPCSHLPHWMRTRIKDYVTADDSRLDARIMAVFKTYFESYRASYATVLAVVQAHNDALGHDETHARYISSTILERIVHHITVVPVDSEAAKAAIRREVPS